MDSSLPALLSNLQNSLDSAIPPSDLDVLPPQAGISLLDIKNELFLSYLQNLVFLIIIKLRHASYTTDTDDGEDTVALNEDATRKLAELRLYLEKGVKPMEGRLKYQIDKVVKAADNLDRDVVHNGTATSRKHRRELPTGANEYSLESGTGSSHEDDESVASSEVDELSYRPNPAALLRPSAGAAKPSTADEPSDGIYKPPRITATSMPVTKGKEPRAERRPMKSATLDEYIATELSTAPVAEPVVGSTIAHGGRTSKTQREVAEQANRTRFEEEHLMRLPKESKKDKAKRGSMNHNGYGGEEWRDLGSTMDRIDNLVKRKGGSGKLERSRKRKIDVGDGPRDSGAAAGTEFAKRKRTVMKRFR